MSDFPSLSGKQLVAALSSIGFIIARIKGSHHFLLHPDGRSTVVPVHANEDIGKGLLSKILRDVEMTREELRKLLR